MRGRILALTLALVIFTNIPVGGAAEPRSYQPPANTPVIPWKRFSLNYAVRVVGNALTSKVEFYITEDGGMTWKKYGEDPDKISPMIITVPGEGTYGLITAVSTNVRPAIPPRPGTKPDRFIIVDRTPPQASWISPNSQNILLTEAGIELSWIASDAHLGLTPVTIEYSTDGGNFWLPLRENLPAKGSINWKPPVINGNTDISLRLIAADLAGNKRIVKNKTTFTLDNTPPVVTILGPSSSGSYKFDIDYTATDDQSGVSNIELYYTVDGGTEWFYFGPDSDLRSPINFSSPAAKEVGLYIVASDKNGNKNPPPARGAMPMSYVTLDMDPPQVNILPPFTTSGEVIAKGQQIDITWNASDANIKEGSAQIQLSTDGGATWTDLAYDKPVNGSWQWVPTAAGNNLLLKISVSDMMGNVGTAISMPFSVDEKRPTMQFESITPINNNGSVDTGSMNQPQDYNSQNDDLWAPPVPSTVELESETITDTSAPIADSGNAGTNNIGDNPFAAAASDAQGNTADNAPNDLTAGFGSEDINTPATENDETVPNIDQNFANNELTDADFAPVNPDETPAPVSESATTDDLSDLDLDSIPDIPAPAPATESAVTPDADLAPAEPAPSAIDIPAPESSSEDSDLSIDDSLLNGDDLAPIPAPESVAEDFPAQTDTTEPTIPAADDMSIPAIPDIGGTTADIDSIENIPAPVTETTVTEETTTTDEIPAIPDLPVPASETNVEETISETVDNVKETADTATDELDLPLDLTTELPAAAETVSLEDKLAQAQTAFEEEEDLDKAEKLAREVIAADPNNARAYAIVASVLTEKGSYDSAFDFAHKAINLAPSSAEYLQILGYAQYQKATEINKMLSSSDLTPAQASNLGSQLITALNQSQEAYSKMLSSTNDVDVKEGYYRLAQVDYFRATRVINNEAEAADTLRKAIANYQKAYAIGQPDYREVLQIGICNYRLTDYDQAEQWLEKAQEVAPVDRAPKEAFFYLALINEKTNRPAQALPFWEKVAEYYPEGSSYRKLAQTRISALSGM